MRVLHSEQIIGIEQKIQIYEIGDLKEVTCQAVYKLLIRLLPSIWLVDNLTCYGPSNK